MTKGSKSRQFWRLGLQSQVFTGLVLAGASLLSFQMAITSHWSFDVYCPLLIETHTSSSQGWEFNIKVSTLDEDLS